ncbi:MAG: type B 50S ribosomal protein L31 [Gordonia sp. (in: high G+C Gram-positive bacteria)]|uniref:type B 50S ribosomal protein L31 n=1 Tax=Gordonia TaxID=2053 RepID=UPI00326481BB
MKSGIHPEYRPIVFRDATTGTSFLTRSTATSEVTVDWSDGNTYPLITVDVTSDSHPFWTGTQRLVDAEGRVERFRRRYGLA